MKDRNMSVNISILLTKSVAGYAVAKASVSTPPEGPADINVSEKHVWSLLLHKTFFFSLENFREIAQKVLLTCTFNGADKHVTCENFEDATSRAKSNVIATVHFTDDDISFYDVPPECLFVKRQSCVLTARELPC